MQPRTFTTFQASRLLGVTLPTVVNWIEGARLRAHRTPGGHRRIEREELASFIRRHGMPMPRELEGEDERPRVLFLSGDGAAASQFRKVGCDCKPPGDLFAAGLSIGLARPDLIVLDLDASKYPALAIASRLRKDPRTRAIPVLVLSGKRGSRRASTLGDEVLVRPFELDELRRSLGAALRARKAT